MFVEPVQNAGGSIPPPPGYFERLREICDTHDVLLVSDEVICAYGRLGTMFGADKFGYQPDIITSAKGLTSGYAALGAAIISDRIFEPFSKGTTSFPHGYTFGGHPVACAAALANLDLFEKEDLLGNVLRNEDAFRATLEKLLDLPIVGNVRGNGYFWSVELVRDQATQGAVHPRRLRADPARRGLTGDVGGRRLLPIRRPRPGRRAVRSPTDLRPGGVRSDRIRDAVGPDRGVGATLRRSCTARQAFRSQT